VDHYSSLSGLFVSVSLLSADTDRLVDLVLSSQLFDCQYLLVIIIIIIIIITVDVFVVIIKRCSCQPSDQANQLGLCCRLLFLHPPSPFIITQPKN